MNVSLLHRQWFEELRKTIANDDLRSLLIALRCFARGKWKMDFQSQNCRISSTEWSNCLPIWAKPRVPAGICHCTDIPCSVFLMKRIKMKPCVINDVILDWCVKTFDELTLVFLQPCLVACILRSLPAGFNRHTSIHIYMPRILSQTSVINLCGMGRSTLHVRECDLPEELLHSLCHKLNVHLPHGNWHWLPIALNGTLTIGCIANRYNGCKKGKENCKRNMD